MVGSSVSWGCWMLLAVLLTLTNTNSTSITVRNVLPQHHQYSGFSPMGALDYGPVPGISAGISSSSSKQDPIGSGCVTAAALANPSISSGLAATAAVPNSSSLAFVGMPSHGLSHSGASSSSQAAAPKQQSSSSGSSGSSNISNTSGRRATTGLLGGNILRSSWSHTEDESIIGESRSDLSTQDRSQLVLQSQMLQQFYRLQNQQFQSLHQFQPPSRISEEPSSGRQAGPQQQRHRSRYSAASTASDQQLDLGNEDDGVEQRGGAQAYSVPLHVLEQVAREERGGSRSLASLAGGGGAAIGNSSSSKRNTIG
ncbi:hypothetical protein GGI07_002215 [Coemansia sp. Benny D115]|nr:hypothetical protein GGI07_002215 [Coemansia sp. Benny D115]